MMSWVSAMLGGNYEEERQDLRSADGKAYDPLGVLLDVIDPDGWYRETAMCRDTWWWAHDLTQGSGLDTEVLPMDLQAEIVRRWADDKESWEEVASFVSEVLPARIAHEHQRLERAA